MKKLSFFLLTALVLGSCKKNDNSPATPSKTDLLTAKNWRPTTVAFSISGIPIPANLSACSQDDFLKFSPDKTLTRDEGATKCSPTDSQTDKGTWDMPSDAKLTLKLHNSGLASITNGTFEIKELSATTMHLISTDTSNGAPATVDVTLTAF